MSRSIVQFLPDRSGHSCGYCKSSDGSITDAMWGHNLIAQDYQDLIDRGWRRSGKYCYKPKMDQTCCPAYTIRCDALNIRLSKSQKKIMRRVRKFLIDGKKNSSEEETTSDDQCQGSSEVDCERKMLENISEPIIDIDMKSVTSSNVDTAGCDSAPRSSSLGAVEQKESCEVSIVPSEDPNQNLPPTSVSCQNKLVRAGGDNTRPAMKKAKLIRKERREKKLLAKLGDAADQSSVIIKNKSAPHVKTLEEFLDDPLPDDRKHNLEMRLVNATEGREAEAEAVGKLVSEELKVYQDYQVAVHNDKLERCNDRQFVRFLVDSPIEQMDSEEESSGEVKYGLYHHQYWLDGKLIAVGVLDLLPSCVSSVYFFYDPQYSFLSLGTYSSLREVALVRSLNRSAPDLKYYYMGFYIHSCPKMRYKAKISPCHLLCPEIYSWHPVEQCLAKLDRSKYCRLNEDADAISRDSNIELNRVLILWKNVVVDFARYKRLSKKNVKSEEFERYAKLVGRPLSQRLLLYADK